MNIRQAYKIMKAHRIKNPETAKARDLLLAVAAERIVDEVMLEDENDDK